MLNMETDPIKKQKRMDEIEMFLKTPLEVINLCDTSSDEEETPEQVSIVTKSKESTRSTDTRKIIHNRLQGVIEKWNSDVSDEEDKQNANEEEDHPYDSRDRDNRDDNQDEEEDRRDTSDSEDETVYEKSDDDSQVSNNGEIIRRGSAKSYEDGNQLNVSVTSYSSHVRSLQPLEEHNQVNRSMSSISSRPSQSRRTYTAEEDGQPQLSNITSSSQVQQSRRRGRDEEEDSQPNRSITSSSSQVQQSKKKSRVNEDESQPSLTSNITQEKESRRNKRIISDDSQPNQSTYANTQPTNLQKNPKIT